MLSDEDMWKLWNAQGSDDMNQQEATAFARAIEAAATAPLLARIAELDRSLDVMAKNTEAQAHASVMREIELTEKVEKLTRQLAEARKDAERYLWLKQDRPVLLLTGFFGNGCVNRTIEEVDTAIDAAIRAAIKEQT